MELFPWQLAYFWTPWKRKRGENMDEQEKRIEEQNKKIEHWLWIVFVSMITSIITTILATM